MEKRLLMFLAALFLCVGGVMAQSTISGTVVDENGDPVVGAAVKVDGTKIGAVTDLDGHFSISAPSHSKLLVNYLGMKEQTVKAGPNVRVVLVADQHTLDDVVVVAYGTQKRSSFTGSAGEMKSEEISKHIVSNATQALSGSVAGVQLETSSGEPGATPKIRIRGVGSMNASTNPLYIVDGAPFDGDIAAINPADIQEMTVLKDAASAAIYGARGSNGVVIITTKKSRGAGAARVTLDVKLGSNHREVPRYDVITDPGQYYETWFKAMYNSKYLHGSNSQDAFNYATANLLDESNGGLGYLVYTVPAGENLIGSNFKLNPNATLGFSDGEYTYLPDDYYDAINNSAFRQEYNLGLNGSSDKVSYYSNLGYLKDGGSVKNSNFERFTARTNVEYQAKSWLKFASNLDYTHIKTQRPSFRDDTYGSSDNLYDIANKIAPIYPMYVRDANGNIMQNAIGGPTYDMNQTNFTRPAISGNAMANNEYDKKNVDFDQFRGNWVMTVTPVDGLNLAANFTMYSRMGQYNYLYSRYASATSIDGQAYVQTTRNFSTNQIYTANYDKQFGNHAINLLAGYEHYYYKESVLYGQNDHLFDPFIAEIGNAYGRSNMKMNSYTDRLVRDGYFFRGDYNYDERYFGELSLRRDGSSIFAPGHRWGTFWSVSAGWQISKEKWFKADWVNLLKLKLSYGVQGNDNMDSGQDLARDNFRFHPWSDFYQISYTEGSDGQQGSYSSVQVFRGNSELTWEKSGEWNFGVDFALFNNRLTGTIDYFHKTTKDLLYMKTLPLSSGSAVATYPANVGEMVNKGIELTVNGDIIKTRNVTLSGNINLTHFKNKITDLDASVKENGIKGGSTILRVGGSIYEAYMLKSAGVDKTNGQPLFYKDETDDDGNVIGQTTTNDATAATKYDLGDVNPSLYGGFGFNFAWTPEKLGTLDFGFQFSFQLGGKIYDGMYQQYMTVVGNGGQTLHKDVLKGWDAVTNPDSNIPVLSSLAADGGNLGQLSVDTYLTSSNYLNLNNVSLGYTFPKQLVQRMYMNNIRMYVTAENLFLISARKGLDPRTYMGVGGYSSGSALIGGGGYPAMRSITAGIQVTF